jgi:hypothetical protein
MRGAYTNMPALREGDSKHPIHRHMYPEQEKYDLVSTMGEESMSGQGNGLIIDLGKDYRGP